MTTTDPVNDAIMKLAVQHRDVRVEFTAYEAFNAIWGLIATLNAVVETDRYGLATHTIRDAMLKLYQSLDLPPELVEYIYSLLPEDLRYLDLSEPRGSFRFFEAPGEEIKTGE